jgi:hypothetical protein
VAALTDGGLAGGCFVSSSRIESYSIDIRLQCGPDAGLLRLIPRDVGSSDHALLTSPSFSIEGGAAGSPLIDGAARQLAQRVASRDDGSFLKAADAARGLLASQRGDHQALVEARHLGLLDTIRRAVVWLLLVFLLGWIVVTSVRVELTSRSGATWVLFLVASFIGALALRILIPPWAPLHANIHGIAELRGLASPAASWRGPVESDRYGPAYRQLVRSLLWIWHGGARSVFAVAAVASALGVVAVAILTAVLTGSRLAGAVAAVGLAVHPIHIALAGSESSLSLAGTLFLIGVASFACVTPSVGRRRTQALYWGGALALAASAELGVTTLALPVAALIIVGLLPGRLPRGPEELWRGPLAVLAGCLALHLYVLGPVIRDALSHRGGDLLATFHSFNGTRNALFDPTLSAVTLAPLALAGLVAVVLRHRSIGIGIAAASVLLLATSAFVNGCRTDVIRYQTDAQLLLFLLAGASILLIPAGAWGRIGAAAVVVALLVLPARTGWSAVHQPLVDAAAFQLLEKVAAHAPSKLFIQVPPGRMGNNEVLSDFPDFLFDARGQSFSADLNPPASAEGCYVWLGPPCYSFSLAESRAHVPDKAIRFGDLPIRAECLPLLSRIDASRPPLAGSDLSVPFRFEEFHHVPDHMYVGLFPCAVSKAAPGLQAGTSPVK